MMPPVMLSTLKTSACDNDMALYVYSFWEINKANLLKLST